MNDRLAALVDNALEIFVYLTVVVTCAVMVAHGDERMREPLMAVIGVLLGRGVRGIVSPRPNAPQTSSVLVAPVAVAPAPPVATATGDGAK